MVIRIYTVTHKNFEKPNDDIYIPIVVGGGVVNIDAMERDNEGENISHLNNKFCEMTALYWVWKNSKLEKEDIIGVSHYRRYFSSKDGGVIGKSELEGIMNNCDILVSKKRNYYITTIKDHYNKAHYPKDLDILRDLVKEKEPDYLCAYDSVFKDRSLSLYNMLVTKYYIYEKYCEWVFPILLEANERIDTKKYDNYQIRVIGFLAERLFNVWLEKNKNSYILKYNKVINTDGEDIIKKGLGFIKRHICK